MEPCTGTGFPRRTLGPGWYRHGGSWSGSGHSSAGQDYRCKLEASSSPGRAGT